MITKYKSHPFISAQKQIGLQILPPVTMDKVAKLELQLLVAPKRSRGEKSRVKSSPTGSCSL